MDRGTTITNSVHRSSEHCRRFTLLEIQSATNNFSATLLIGRGGFGKVYKGFIDDGTTMVAVKRLNPESKQGAGEFWTEIKTLYGLRHPHLITLIGYSDDEEEMILVYECMTNGTLADHLYRYRRDGKGKDFEHLTWTRRLNICIGAARGLDYLHDGTEQSVIHRDVKTTNILLNQNWMPKISDFGLSKMGTTSQTQTHVSTDVKGTFGYLDPQYFLTRRLTKKSDVYAFGVVLFEALCGRPPVDFGVEEEQCSLAQWVQQCVKRGVIAQVVDPSLRGQLSCNCLKAFTEVAYRCLHNHPKARPTMAQVARSLELVLASEGTLTLSKGIFTKVPLYTAHLLLKTMKIGQKKLENLTFRNRLSTQLNSDPHTRKGTQIFRCFTLIEIRAATNNFDEHLVVGHNIYSTVYRGVINSENIQVAVKRWKERRCTESFDIFNEEIQVLSQLHHIHLVSLIGYCKERHELIIVYDYMVNGSLDKQLYQFDHHSLPWRRRLKICIDAARGLHYLHSGAKQPIIHRNLKLSNILLDQNWVAKLAGLEFPKVLLQEPDSTSFNPLLAGTVGYMDPEYILTGRLSMKSDVYSFGVILLELLCGRKPMILNLNEDQVSLVQWFKINLQTGTLDQVIVPQLVDKIAPKCLTEYAKLADSCTHRFEAERPSMESVLDTLRYALQLQETWQDLKQSFGPCQMFPEAISLSQDKTSPERGTKGTSFAYSEDTDYMSEALTR